jgi:hypothetical protein
MHITHTSSMTWMVMPRVTFWILYIFEKEQPPEVEVG